MAALPDLPHSAFAAPELECDIVMKGGITSGVVYPGAVTELAQHYRFRSIGGTSAGAIAAVLVAAAEHRRRTDPADPGAGFGDVQALAGTLAGPADGTPLLQRLFQPDPRTQRLFAIAMGWARSPMAGVFATARAFPWGVLLAVVASVAAALWLPTAVAVGVVCAALVTIVLAPVVGVVRSLLRDLPANHFGLCTLGPRSVRPRGDRTPALTAWLHERIQAIAGVPNGPVLTFADLWGASRDDHDDLLARSRETDRRAVDLQMMTTNLTHGRPWRLPSAHQPYVDRLEQGGELLFDSAELERFFPEDVLAALEAAGGEPSPKRQAILARLAPGRRLLRFPVGPDLPVVVAARMSLSFPVLIAAVPLWEIIHTSHDERLQRVIFSDGGISSNFPVHFFDAALPRRPTFGLQLSSLPPGVKAPTDIRRQGDIVVPPPRVNEQAPVELRQIASMRDFGTAIKDAMQNWRDNVQAAQPGFRDRVIRIPLAPHEGGLNLRMKREQVLALSARGAAAGSHLLDRFATPDTASGALHGWNDHRFVRFRIAAAVGEQYLRTFGRAWSAGAPGPGTTSYAIRVAAGLEGPYKYRSARRLDNAARLATTLARMGNAEPADLDRGAPRPPSVLRTMPPT